MPDLITQFSNVLLWNAYKLREEINLKDISPENYTIKKEKNKKKRKKKIKQK